MKEAYAASPLIRDEPKKSRTFFGTIAQTGGLGSHRRKKYAPLNLPELLNTPGVSCPLALSDAAILLTARTVGVRKKSSHRSS